jgi:hypothetical protein
VQGLWASGFSQGKAPGHEGALALSPPSLDVLGDCCGDALVKQGVLVVPVVHVAH